MKLFYVEREFKDKRGLLQTEGFPITAQMRRKAGGTGKSDHLAPRKNNNNNPQPPKKLSRQEED